MNEELTKGEQVFPDGWRHARFGDVATLQRGFDLPVQARTPGSFPVIGSNGVVGFHNEAKVPGPAVVIGRSGTIGKSFYTEGAYWPLNTGLYVKDFHDNDPLFLHFFFHVFDFGKYSAGVSVPTLNRNLVHEAIVCIPPFPEQRIIAAVLSRIQAAMEVQDKIVATLKELKAATMAKLFREGLRGEPLKQTEFGEIPESWEVVQVGSLLKLSSGDSRPNDLSVECDEVTSFPVYGGNGVMGYSSRYLTSQESIVIGRVGAYCGSVHVCPPHSWITDNALYHRDPVSEKVSLHFLAELLAYLRLNRLHRKGAQPLVTQGTVHAVKIQLPPRPEQEEIAHTATQLNRRIQIAEQRLEILKSFFSSMLHLLMTGQVRVNNLKAEEAGK